MTDRTLDAALGAWARTDPLQGAGDEAALLRILQHADALAISGPAAAPKAHHHPWWWLGGLSAVAASIAIVALTGPSIPKISLPPSGNDDPVVVADAGLDDGPVFALLFTPTDDEEYQL